MDHTILHTAKLCLFRGLIRTKDNKLVFGQHRCPAFSLSIADIYMLRRNPLLFKVLK